MGVVELDLQSGFDSIDVEIYVDSELVLHKVGVKTRYQIGLAETCKLSLKPGAHEVRVRLVKNGVVASAKIDPDTTPYLGVNFDEGQLELTPSVEPFHYL